MSYEHRFCFHLPREYPHQLARIRIINLTPLYHPRIRGTGASACYAVNGEIDRICIDIIYNILMRPETIRPPSQFKDSDWGLDRAKMEWYIQYGPQKLYRYLKTCWAEKQQPLGDQTPPRRKVQILGE